MNASMQVLQALDAAQDAFRRVRGATGDTRAEIARNALQQVVTAPWSMVFRAPEADQHGWLAQVQDALRQIEDDPDADDIEALADEGLWAANELERDLRQTVGAR
jgi:hypothetical protein